MSLAKVVQRVDNAIRRINCCPMDNVCGLDFLRYLRVRVTLRSLINGQGKTWREKIMKGEAFRLSLSFPIAAKFPFSPLIFPLFLQLFYYLSFHGSKTLQVVTHLSSRCRKYSKRWCSVFPFPSRITTQCLMFFQIAVWSQSL